ncbi:hypothetical protein [Tessaracoccus flavus]|uniref:Uncharacterized protein n=1 Tax=Tessaracoccus flavus TaxID=1610493 RepID=A0A1Q2CEE7_9ACTN|nr:hypothetical protein [Tessaracoccus flavus]AQP44502.1 hypothetical protein RPIT_06495 [Tessaracoccus flavus]SDY71446.1 hypothetical protein SAMN05428934_103244 [Tessaracoccus flavus]
MSSIAQVRRLPTGSPGLSVSFLLARTPAPHDRISDLVLSATVAVELSVDLPGLGWVGFRLDTAEGASAQATGPFGTAALATTLVGDEARELLLALAGGAAGPMLHVRVRFADGRLRDGAEPLAQLIRSAAGDRLADHVRLVTAEGGELTDVPPARPARTRGGGRDLLLLRKDQALPITQVVRPKAVQAIRHDLLLAVGLKAQESGPILDGSALLQDRDGASRWFIPELTLVLPEPGADPDASPFSFSLVPAGHQADGSPGMEATIVLTLAAGRSAATTEAWEGAGRPAARPIPVEPRIGLRIPLRNEQGVGSEEIITASNVRVDGALGEEGSTLTATFALRDTWARLAYGALSTPGFQDRPASLDVTLSYSGWRRETTPTRRETVSGTKLIGLRRPDNIAKALPATQIMGMAKAKIGLTPALATLDVGLLKQFRQSRFVRLMTATTQSLPVLVPCAEHGQLYRQHGPSGWESVGCQPALRLGQAEHRVWQPEPAASVAGARVFRSLTQPGRFLVVAAGHAIGRYGADEPDRAYEPTLLLTSTIDVDDPANIRCVLAASLEAELSDAELDLLKAELSARIGRPADLVTPWQAGLTPELRWAAPQAVSLDCVAIDTGFTLVLSTDIPGLLTLKALLQRSGLMGSARYRLPGGDEAISTLRLDLSRVTGPPGGPVTVTAAGDGLTLTNHLSRRVAVHRIVTDGVVVAQPGVVLDPGGEATVQLATPAGGPFHVDSTVEPGAESLDETRSYIEDLHLAVTFVATGDLAGLTGLEIAAQFLGSDAEPVILTRSKRQAEREFVLPLTTYAADPALTFTVSSVADDGTRVTASPVSWPVRTRGVLIPIPNP